ncbi:transcriptional regulator with XRE-family HTH domain [Dyadobacter sp. BE34]|uniref:Transcriptional regulator with XRE-family HTH domain n=1 Tax=Dyadobacter fermentans TaxID=94254 RepID=A0ABU1QUP9_9BACT|nr:MULTISPECIES: helix-turn-helix transcriptional regulator [Dyadobacter]MDR6804485.1 transcriptional regulator with XRE-family HTH domain [Dyadobacter fermentans]MDR7042225.1 transcriptional regulator with XRE-family HTH domain [Dyadobacter sp. BE242]MDR7196627.1 transcriptional regulator with XRE-family HTH domain [Dyadobacter sp. BE34]MDR7212827.1 transcriptional regulator with XRE-family HTH domain [Dyadobacter sp. BE31]MDR7262034.1 transcriptional regulator with XRE-family HTH domain [Dya
MKEHKIPIGDNIRLVRNRLGYSQEYVAGRLGISKQRYRQLENEEQDSITMGRLSEIAAVLETDIETLVSLHKVKFLKAGLQSEDSQVLHQLIQTQQELIIALKGKTSSE